MARLRAHPAWLVLLMWALAAPASAQTYPSKNLTIVVSLAAGTGMDALTRLYAERDNGSASRATASAGRSETGEGTT